MPILKPLPATVLAETHAWLAMSHEERQQAAEQAGWPPTLVARALSVWEDPDFLGHFQVLLNAVHPES